MNKHKVLLVGGPCDRQLVDRQRGAQLVFYLEMVPDKEYVNIVHLRKAYYDWTNNNTATFAEETLTETVYPPLDILIKR